MDVIGPLQLRVMRHIWQQGSATVHDVHKALNGQVGVQQLAYTTILTVMRNLAKRRFLSQEHGGRSHVFRPLVNRKEYQERVLRQVLHDLYDGDAARVREDLDRLANSPEVTAQAG